MLVAAHGQTFFHTSNVVSGVHNFSGYGRTIVGIMKGFLGLSGAVLIRVYYTLFKNQPSNFILMLALFPTAVSLLLFFFSPVAVAAMRQEFIESDKFLLETNILVSGSQSEPGKDTEEAPSQYPASSIDAAIQNTRVHMNIIQAVCTGNFWLLFIAMGLARPLVMAIMWFIRTGGHVIIASGFPGNLYIGSTLVGVCFGSLWSLMPTITSEIFGLSHMGTIFNTIAIASPVGSYILSERVIGYIYDKEATGDGNSCYGTHCFMLSSLILASVAFFWFLVNLLLFFRTRSSY
ncbi:hypothetical protein CDL15_Pgr014756 [Punica granatum]|uniref:Uncharacterized protein n=1 Tax=Punica granatum TaxID=22663 RepID=A0A218XZM1_PUNGR|nr:hypothetical protein CDL15_Pgr014756 [Punica granatum]